MTYPLLLQFGRAIPGDGFDGWQNYWNLWWVRKALLELGTTPYFTSLLYYPSGVSLAFQTMNLFNSLVSLPISLLAGLLPAYNAIAFFSFVAGAFGAYLLARDALGRSGWRARWTVWPAFAAGCIYAFAPFHFAHLLGHMQVFSLEWLPFAALSLLRGLDRLDRPAGNLGEAARAALPAALFLILTGLCDWYFAYYMALFTALLALYRLLGGRLRGRHILFLTLSWSGFLLILSPIWLPMLREAGVASYMVPEAAQARSLSADLLAFVTPSEFHPLWGKAVGAFAGHFTSTISERTIFAGFVPLALGLLAALRLGRRSRFWWIAALAFALCALGPVLHIAGQPSLPMPYALLYQYVPFARIARSISRFDVMVMLSLSVLAALGLGILLKSLRLRRPALLGLTASALICFEFLSAPYPFSTPDTPAFYEDLAAEPGAFAVLNLPMNWDRPGYLLYQTTHQRPLIAGYITRDDPRTLVYRMPVLQEFRALGADILCPDISQLGPSVLAWLNVRYVILDRYKMPSGAEREVTTALAEQIFAGVAPAYEDERLTVYRVAPPAELRPFPILETGWSERRSETGSIWREISARAEVTAQQVESGRPYRMVVRASGPSGSRLRLSDAAGAAQEAPLSPDGGEITLDWTPAASPAHLTLTLLGPGPARVSQLRIEPSR